jgi:urease accessory protein UreF
MLNQIDTGMTALIVVAGLGALALAWQALTVWLPFLWDVCDRLLTDAVKSVVYDQKAIQAKREKEILEHFGGKAED